MAFQHRPLSDEELGPAVLKMAGPEAPAKMRMMVAKGVAPLPPRDLVVALYQLWVGNEPTVSDDAAKSVTALPPPVLAGALGDPQLPAGALDLIARKKLRDVETLEKLVAHPMVDDQTLVGIARVCPEKICDVLADNQTRWTRTPDIVVSLYGNPNCRMSVVHRMLEFAEREGIQIRLPMMDEIRQALKEDQVDESRDELFKKNVRSDEQINAQIARLEGASVAEEDVVAALDEAAAAAEGEAPEAPPTDPDQPEAEPVQEDITKVRKSRLQEIMEMRTMEKVRAALLGDAFDRSVLIRDSNKTVAMSVVKSPKVKENEVVGWSSNRSLSHDVIRYISNRRDWIKLYTVKLNLVFNPKTPLSKSMSLLAFLNAQDVRKVARSKNISSALAKAAKRKDQSRR